MIHILTLTYNGISKLKKLQKSLYDNLADQNFIWHIRSNGCSDKTSEIAFYWPHVKLLVKDHNRDSFSKGVNSLFELSGAEDNDLVLLLNNDIEFKSPNNIKQMISLLNKEKASMCGCRMLYSNTNTVSHAGVAFSIKRNNLPWNLHAGQKSRKEFDQKNRYFQAVTAACCLIRAKDFKEVNGMDENYFWMYEDIDLCLKIKELNKKIVYCGKTEIDHETSATLKTNNYNKLMLNKNVGYFKNKWNGKYKIDLEKYEEDSSYNEIK